MSYNTQQTNTRKSDTAMKVRPDRRNRDGLRKLGFVAGMTAAALVGSAGVADALQPPAPMIPAATSAHGPVAGSVVRIGEHMTGGFEVHPGQILIEHYAIDATGDHIIARCADIGGAVVFDHVRGWNGYACSGVDF